MSPRRILLGALAALAFATPRASLLADEVPAEPPAPLPAVRPLVVPLSPVPAAGQQLPLPVPSLPVTPHLTQGRADVKSAGVLSLAVNKTLPIDLPSGARDVVLGNPSVADVLMQGTRRAFLMGHAVGDTNVFFLDETGGVVKRVELHVGPDAEGARAAIAQVLPDERVEVKAIGDALFLSGKVRSNDAANTARLVARRFVAADANVINRLSVAGSQQVLLKVRVAEMSRTVLKQLGLQTSYTGGSAASMTAGYVFTQTTPIGLAGTFNSGRFSFDVSALEQEGLVKTLAEPNLTTLSGEAARLLAGGEEPIPTANTNGVVTVAWKPFGVGLVFSPTILSNGRISLRVESEVSAIDKSIAIPAGTGITIYGMKTRRANSVVELPSGGSMMMAGLLQNEDTENLNGIPGVRDLPILGALLGSTDFQRGETELVVTVSAYLVEPVDNKQLGLPTDGFIPSSDLRRYLLMKLEENYSGKRVDVAPSALRGPFGYIVE